MPSTLHVFPPSLQDFWNDYLCQLVNRYRNILGQGHLDKLERFKYKMVKVAISSTSHVHCNKCAGLGSYDPSNDIQYR